ncbi:MAG: TM2 domain-containing protein [Elainellaceae cyanobacterium]
MFNAELDRKRKNAAIAYALYFFLGTIGGHKFYIGKPLTGFFYIVLLSLGFLFMLGGFVSAFDTTATTEDMNAVFAVGFPPLGLLSIMMLVDLFTIPGQIKKQEDRVRNDLLTRLVSSKA